MLFAIKGRLRRAKVLLSLLQGRLSGNALVGSRGLLRTVKRSLRAGKGLLGRRLASGECLFLRKEAGLLRTVQCVLRGIEILLCCLDGGLGTNALVCQGGLLRTVKLSLGGSEVLVDLILACVKLLRSCLQTKLVLLACVELPADVNGRLIGQCAIAEGGCVSGSDRGRPLQHGRHSGALGH